MTTSSLALLGPSAYTAPLAGPTAGGVAQATLAADAAAVLQWVSLVSLRPGVAEVPATVNALLRLRTDLRTLRPILRRDWSVGLREELKQAQELLAAVEPLDREVRLPLLAMAEVAIEPATVRTLTSLADGNGPAPLRTAAPLGDAHQPSAFVLPAMLYRRWRKISQGDRSNRPADVGAAYPGVSHRR